MASSICLSDASATLLLLLSLLLFVNAVVSCHCSSSRLKITQQQRCNIYRLTNLSGNRLFCLLLRFDFCWSPAVVILCVNSDPIYTRQLIIELYNAKNETGCHLDVSPRQYNAWVLSVLFSPIRRQRLFAVVSPSLLCSAV